MHYAGPLEISAAGGSVGEGFEKSAKSELSVTRSVALTVVKGPGAGAVLQVTGPRRLIVGRGNDSDWTIHDPSVSRRHVLLEIAPPACRLQDIGFGGSGSVNAPRLNGRPVRCCELKDGDVFDLGLTSVRVSISFLNEDAADDSRGIGMPVAAGMPHGQPAQAPQANLEEIRCQSCQLQLSSEANSDGRAAELHGSVAYSCANCLPAGDAHAGERVGSYELLRLLGEGGMGTVYLAYHRATARIAALKRITDVEDSGAVKRFAREVRLLGQLSHGRVLRFIETGVDQTGKPFVVTEYLPGGNLECFLQEAGTPPVQTAVKLVREVLEGIGYLHSSKVIHRDIKPENVLLRFAAEGKMPSALIADFGISWYYEQAGGTRLTKPGTRMGTLMFMPPEQVRDAREAREPADTYAAGVMLYYLLTGHYTFEFPTPASIREFRKKAAAFRTPDQAVRDIMRLERVRHPFRIILEEEPTPVLARASHLPARLAAVIDKAVRKDERRRFQNAEEFRAELSFALR